MMFGAIPLLARLKVIFRLFTMQESFYEIKSPQLCSTQKKLTHQFQKQCISLDYNLMAQLLLHSSMRYQLN